MCIKRSKRSLFFVVLGIMCFAMSPAMADTEANKALSLRVFEEVWNQGAIDVIDEVVSEDYIIHDASGVYHGAEGYRQFHGLFNSAFSGIHFTVEDQIAEGDWVANRWTSTSTHTGELMGVPATGNSALVTGVTASRVVDGRIVEEYNDWNLMGLMNQIGAMPTTITDHSWGAPSEVTGDPGDPLANKLIVINYTEEFWNLKRLNAFDNTNSIDAIGHAPTSGTNPKGFEKLKHDQSNFIAGMPDVKVEIQGLIAEGDRVVSRYTTSGTSLNSGKKITFTGINIYRIADGKIVESWWSYDYFGMVQQVMAPPQHSPVGTWISTVPTPLGNMTMLHTINPSDFPGGPYAGVLKQVNTNPTHFGMFPDIEDGPDWVTQTVSKGNNTFETTMLVYGTKTGEGPLAETAAIYLAHVDWTITGPDTNEGSTVLGIYLAEQDGDGDGMPDEGEEPIDCQVFSFTTIRFKALTEPPCVPVIPEL